MTYTSGLNIRMYSRKIHTENYDLAPSIVELFSYRKSAGNLLSVEIMDDNQIQDVVDQIDPNEKTVFWWYMTEGINFLTIENLTKVARKTPNQKHVINICAPPVKSTIDLWRNLEEKYGWFDANIGIIVSNVFFYHYAHHAVNSDFADSFSALDDYSKRFIYLNHNDKKERAEMLGILSYRDLLKDFHATYVYHPNMHEQYSTEARLGLEKLISDDCLPLRLDSDEEWINSIGDPMMDIQHSIMPYIKDSAFYLVAETVFYSSKYLDHTDPRQYTQMTHIPFLEHAHYSEKMIKAMVCRRPFIVMNRPRALQIFQELGFKTFHPYIDESYDLEENDDLRMLMIAKEVERICNLSEKEFQQLRENCVDALEHNFKKLLVEDEFSIMYNVTPR